MQYNYFCKITTVFKGLKKLQCTEGWERGLGKFRALHRLMGCQNKHLGQAVSDLPLSEIFTTRWRSKLGKTAQKLHLWALSVVLGAIPRLVGYL